MSLGLCAWRKLSNRISRMMLRFQLTLLAARRRLLPLVGIQITSDGGFAAEPEPVVASIRRRHELFVLVERHHDRRVLDFRRLLAVFMFRLR